jgi:hypothetical protein
MFQSLDRRTHHFYIIAHLSTAVLLDDLFIGATFLTWP